MAESGDDVSTAPIVNDATACILFTTTAPEGLKTVRSWGINGREGQNKNDSEEKAC